MCMGTPLSHVVFFCSLLPEASLCKSIGSGTSLVNDRTDGDEQMFLHWTHVTCDVINYV